MTDWTPPRRIRIDQQTPIEAAIRAAIDAVEAGPAHPHMTKATNLLGQALNAAADFVDGVPEAPPADEHDSWWLVEVDGKWPTEYLYCDADPSDEIPTLTDDALRARRYENKSTAVKAAATMRALHKLPMRAVSHGFAPMQAPAAPAATGAENSRTLFRLGAFHDGGPCGWAIEYPDESGVAARLGYFDGSRKNAEILVRALNRRQRMEAAVRKAMEIASDEHYYAMWVGQSHIDAIVSRVLSESAQ